MARQSKLMEQRERLRRTIQADQRAPRADWRHGSFAWDAKVSQLLHDVFRLEGGFRPLQREVINATMQGRDVLCLLPSGSGKSVCYQLPALAQDGLTLVISPLLSLIHDQVLALKALGIPAAGWTSMTGKEEAAALLAALDPKAWQQRQQTTSGGKSASAPSAPPLRLLYVTPEKVVASKRLMAKLEKLAAGGLLCRIAVDEAHCCSVLGNDFRPDYKKLGVLKQQFPAVPLLALTATATQAVVQDLKSILRIDGCELFRLSVDRPNLFYSVRHKPAAAADVTADMVAWIRVHCPPAGRGSRLGPGGGIVYCLSRKETEVLAAELVEAGLSAAHYHADMEAADRLRAHEAWSRGDVQIMVATTAFGMGVSRADVRFVIHHSLSKSAENYYQVRRTTGPAVGWRLRLSAAAALLVN